MDIKEWTELAYNGTSGDMVFDILRDWKIERDTLKAENERLREALEEINRKAGECTGYWHLRAFLRFADEIEVIAKQALSHEEER